MEDTLEIGGGGLTRSRRKSWRRPPQTMLDVIREAGAGPSEDLPIPGTRALPEEMTAEQIDKRLAAMTNTAIYDAYAPTRDARDFSEHSKMQARYQVGLHHLAKEAEKRGLGVDRGVILGSDVTGYYRPTTGRLL